MIKRYLFNINVVWSVLFVLSILLLASCDLFTSAKSEREDVSLDHIMIPPPKRTDYIGINIEDSIATFYAFKPYKDVTMFKQPDVDCMFYAQWCNYKGESWLLLRGVMGILHPNHRSFASIHLQVSPKDWVVHRASVFFYDRLRMDEQYIPSIYEELRKKDPYFRTPSLVAKEDVKVDIYKKDSSRACVKGVISGTFTQWSTFVTGQSSDTKKKQPPYGDAYPESLSEYEQIYYTPVNEPKKFKLSFTAIEALRLDPDVLVVE